MTSTDVEPSRGCAVQSILFRLRFCSNLKHAPCRQTDKSTALASRNGSASASPPDPEVTQTDVKKAPFQVMGLDATPELTAIFLVYFVQGILGLSRLAVSYYFKDELGMDPAELAIFQGFSTLPWLIKPLYGFASDTFPIFGSRRRSYLVLCGILGSAAWASMFALHPNAELASFLLLIGSAGVACSDVVVDSIVVEASRGQPGSVAGANQTPAATRCPTQWPALGLTSAARQRMRPCRT